ARMERLTTDLLELARAEAGPRASASARLDLGGLVNDELRRAVPEGRRLIAGAPVPHVEVDGDRDQLARVLSNLVDNALRHAHVQVTISLTHGTTSAEIRVVDDGPGIAAEHREQVFHPFVRLDPHRARSEGGTGLGLAIVREVVRAHGGTVEVTGDQPGATFVVRLPLAAGATLRRG
ncbi:MAG: ATP-binding protein, partial [Ilumatobacteraceae bacterium]